MNNNEVYDRILVKARRPGDATLRSNILNEMTEMLSNWERGPFFPWFLEKTSSGLVTTANVETVALPSDYLLLVEDTKVWIIQADGTRTYLQRGFHEDMEEKWNGVSATLPTTFDIFADQIYLGATPDRSDYTIRMKYYKKTTPPPDDTTTVSNPWVINAQGLFVSETARRLVANYIKDDKTAQSLEREVAQVRADLFKYNEARKHVEMDYRVDR